MVIWRSIPVRDTDSIFVKACSWQFPSPVTLQSEVWSFGDQSLWETSGSVFVMACSWLFPSPVTLQSEVWSFGDQSLWETSGSIFVTAWSWLLRWALLTNDLFRVSDRKPIRRDYSLQFGQGNLKIFDVQPSDRGTYVCSAKVHTSSGVTELNSYSNLTVHSKNLLITTSQLTTSQFTVRTS